ncbi:hypothetical protein BDM02DRAFT_857152 [Thelephora ganbajun]|uniref:Uncharacterized protein n=1 Tax=Thelephora ganbajun TaxID=370292 RepID=A0ACB6ZNK4_THEGA|nr:hypothetical protein BDM02DRAFT_857152 [Thelephora ganbajun]
MDDVISIFSSPAATRNPPRVDLGMIEITDSEPEELDNDDLFWTKLKDKNAARNASPHRSKDNVKEDSPMDVDATTAQAGPSAPLPAPDPFPDAPLIHTQPEVDLQIAQETDTDPYSRHLALVLEVIPDVLPKHAVELIVDLYPAYKDQVVERVLQDLFDDPSYPKVEKDVAGKGKGKRKASEMEDALERPPSRVKVDFASVNRPKPAGRNYRMLVLNQLYADFPYVPVTHVRRVLASNNGLYAPTHIQLTAESESDVAPFTMKAVKTKVSMGKGKEREMQDEDFEKERTWLLLKDVPVTQEVSDTDEFVQNQAQGGKGTPATDMNVLLEEEGGLECGCCFSPAPFHNMIQCPDTHLFCTECMVAYASNLLGEHNFKIVCMDQSGCKLPFPESELKRFLTPKLLSLYEKIKQAKEIEMAGLDGLEECPHCEFKVVIDNPSERLFRCQNEECGAVTCRKCKKPDHLPKSCAEVDEDKKIDARHVVEEAMTNALLRNCPQCNKVFIKESGCNKMTCPNCLTLSCYVCRKVITGYEHFNESRPGQPQRAERAGKCLLWDKVEERHQGEVEEAQKRAIAEYRKKHPEMGEDVLQVELPKVTGEASSSRIPGRRVRRPWAAEPVGELGPAQRPVFDHRLLEPVRRDHLQDPAPGIDAAFQFPNAFQMVHPVPEIPEVRLPGPPPKIPYLPPVRTGQHLQEVQEVPQQREEDLRRHPEDNRVRQRRLAQQQRVLAGRFIADNLRNPRPAALPDDPTHPIPRLQGNRAGGVRMDPADRGRVDQWRRGVPGPKDGPAAL